MPLRLKFDVDARPTRVPRVENSSVMLLWLVAIVVFTLDRYSKSVVASFAPGESRLVIPRLLWWTYVQNRHGAFGLFGNSPGLLTALAMGVLAILAFGFRDGLERSRFVRVGIGNVVDRVQHHWVIDFIDFRTIWPNVFNVGDTAICVGTALLIVGSFTVERSRAKSAFKSGQRTIGQ